MQRMQEAQQSADQVRMANSDSLNEPIAVHEVGARSKSSEQQAQPLIFSAAAGGISPELMPVLPQSPAKQQGPLSKQQSHPKQHVPSEPSSSSSTFEVHPGSRTPTTSFPIYNPAGPIKRSQADENMLAELQASGRWKNGTTNSAINSTNSNNKSTDRRPSIRANEPTGRMPFEFIALLVVIVCGVTAIWATQMPSETTKRAEHLLHSGNLEGAGGALQSWRLNGVHDADQERFSELCMQLGRTYMGKQNYVASAVYFDLVPERSRQYAEARALSRKCRKAIAF